MLNNIKMDNWQSFNFTDIRRLIHKYVPESAEGKRLNCVMQYQNGQFTKINFVEIKHLIHKYVPELATDT